MRLTVGFVYSLAFAALLPWLGQGLSLPPADDEARNQSWTVQRRGAAKRTRRLTYYADVLYNRCPTPQEPEKMRVLAVYSWLEFSSTRHDIRMRVSLASERDQGSPAQETFVILAAEYPASPVKRKRSDDILPNVRRHTFPLASRVDVTNEEIMNADSGRGILFDIWSADPEYRSGPSQTLGEPARYNGCNRFILNVLAHPRIYGPTYDLLMEAPDVYRSLMVSIGISETEVARKIDRNVRLSLADMRMQRRPFPYGRFSFRETTTVRKSWDLSLGFPQEIVRSAPAVPKASKWLIRQMPDEMSSLFDVVPEPPEIILPVLPWGLPHVASEDSFLSENPTAEVSAAPVTLSNIPSAESNNLGAGIGIPIYRDSSEESDMTAFDGLGSLLPHGSLDLPSWSPSADMREPMKHGTAEFNEPMDVDIYDVMESDMTHDPNYWQYFPGDVDHQPMDPESRP